MPTLKSDLSQIIKGEILDDPETLQKYSIDASIFTIIPSIVVAPKDVADIRHLVKFATEKKIPLTPRAAGTDMSGGAINEGIILDLTKHFNQIKKITAGKAVTQPGVFYRDFELETLKKGYLLPTYPASRELCSVGGMVANNAAGEKTLTFGQTYRFVKSLKAVLSDANEYTLTALSSSRLQQKLSQDDFEGNLYRRVHQLLEKNFDLIQQSKPKVSKNSSGYLLWEVWDRNKFDLSKLLVGSQGTLGIVTEIEFELIKPKPYSNLLVIFLYDLSKLTLVVEKVLKFHPESFESFDDRTLQFTLRFLPEVLKVIHPKHIFSLLLGFIPEMIMGTVSGFPKLVLLAEFTDDTQEGAIKKAQECQNALEQFGLKMRVTKDVDDTKKYWTIRRESFNLFRHHAGGKQTVPFIDDIIVDPVHYSEFLPALDQLLAPYKKDMIYTIAGHIGNGNFHIIPLMDLKSPRTQQIIEELTPKVHKLVFKYHGSMTAEHNDGLIRGPYLEEMYGNKTYHIFREIKLIFDPDGIFNPHKKVNATLEYSMGHLKHS